MPSVITVNGITPFIDSSVWLAQNVIVTGDTHIDSGSSIWFGVVIRGDVNKIRIGKNVNVQDLTMIHGTKGRSDTIIGDNVSIGHRAIIHGCQIQSDVLIGMGAIVLDDVIVPSNCIVAAGAVVTSGTKMESGYIYAGIPAKKIKRIDEAQSQLYIKGTAEAYKKYSSWYDKTE